MRPIGLVRKAVLPGALALALCGSPDARRAPTEGPRVLLWGWERPEDLHFIDPAEVGVAFLAATVRLHGEAAAVRLRGHRLTVPTGTFLTAVVRIEMDRGAALSPGQRRECVESLLRAAGQPGVVALQIDLDARESERTFYRSLLTEVRAALPPRLRLSITALASWCLDDPWIRDLPIDDAVPMLFRMGPEGWAIRGRLQRGEGFRVGACRRTVGLALDEPAVTPFPPRQTYVFSTRPWSPDSVRQAVRLGRE